MFRAPQETLKMETSPHQCKQHQYTIAQWSRLLIHLLAATQGIPQPVDFRVFSGLHREGKGAEARGTTRGGPSVM